MTFLRERLDGEGAEQEDLWKGVLSLETFPSTTDVSQFETVETAKVIRYALDRLGSRNMKVETCKVTSAGLPPSKRFELSLETISVPANDIERIVKDLSRQGFRPLIYQVFTEQIVAQLNEARRPQERHDFVCNMLAYQARMLRHTVSPQTPAPEKPAYASAFAYTPLTPVIAQAGDIAPIIALEVERSGVNDVEDLLIASVERHIRWRTDRSLLSLALAQSALLQRFYLDDPEAAEALEQRIEAYETTDAEFAKNRTFEDRIETLRSLEGQTREMVKGMGDAIKTRPRQIFEETKHTCLTRAKDRALTAINEMAIELGLPILGVSLRAGQSHLKTADLYLFYPSTDSSPSFEVKVNLDNGPDSADLPIMDKLCPEAPEQVEGIRRPGRRINLGISISGVSADDPTGALVVINDTGINNVSIDERQLALALEDFDLPLNVEAVQILVETSRDLENITIVIEEPFSQIKSQLGLTTPFTLSIPLTVDGELVDINALKANLKKQTEDYLKAAGQAFGEKMKFQALSEVYAFGDMTVSASDIVLVTGADAFDVTLDFKDQSDKLLAKATVRLGSRPEVRDVDLEKHVADDITQKVRSRVEAELASLAGSLDPKWLARLDKMVDHIEVEPGYKGGEVFLNLNVTLDILQMTGCKVDPIVIPARVDAKNGFSITSPEGQIERLFDSVVDCAVAEAETELNRRLVGLLDPDHKVSVFGLFEAKLTFMSGPGPSARPLKDAAAIRASARPDYTVRLDIEQGDHKLRISDVRIPASVQDLSMRFGDARFECVSGGEGCVEVLVGDELKALGNAVEALGSKGIIIESPRIGAAGLSFNIRAEDLPVLGDVDFGRVMIEKNLNVDLSAILQQNIEKAIADAVVDATKKVIKDVAIGSFKLKAVEPVFVDFPKKFCLKITGVLPLFGGEADATVSGTYCTDTGKLKFKLENDASLKTALAKQLEKIWSVGNVVEVTNTKFRAFENPRENGLIFDLAVNLDFVNIRAERIEVTERGLRRIGALSVPLGPEIRLSSEIVIADPAIDFHMDEGGLGVRGKVTAVERSIADYAHLDATLAMPKLSELRLTLDASLVVMDSLTLMSATGEIDIGKSFATYEAKTSPAIADILDVSSSGTLDGERKLFTSHAHARLLGFGIATNSAVDLGEKKHISFAGEAELPIVTAKLNAETDLYLRKPEASGTIGFKVAKFDIGGAEMDIDMRRAEMDFRFIGLKVGIVTPTVNAMSKGYIADILASLLDIDLSALLDIDPKDIKIVMMSGSGEVSECGGFSCNGGGGTGGGTAEGGGQEGAVEGTGTGTTREVSADPVAPPFETEADDDGQPPSVLDPGDAQFVCFPIEEDRWVLSQETGTVAQIKASIANVRAEDKKTDDTVHASRRNNAFLHTKGRAFSKEARELICNKDSVYDSRNGWTLIPVKGRPMFGECQL